MICRTHKLLSCDLPLICGMQTEAHKLMMRATYCKPCTAISENLFLMFSVMRQYLLMGRIFTAKKKHNLFSFYFFVVGDSCGGLDFPLFSNSTLIICQNFAFPSSTVKLSNNFQAFKLQACKVLNLSISLTQIYPFLIKLKNLNCFSFNCHTRVPIINIIKRMTNWDLNEILWLRTHYYYHRKIYMFCIFFK